MSDRVSADLRQVFSRAHEKARRLDHSPGRRESVRADVARLVDAVTKD